MEKNNPERKAVPSRDYLRPYKIFNPDGSPVLGFNPDGSSEILVRYYNKTEVLNNEARGNKLIPTTDIHRKIEKIIPVLNLAMDCEICEDIPGVKIEKANNIIRYKDDGEKYHDEGKRFVCEKHANKKPEREYWWDKI
jgi:hypothetical protein